MARIKEKNDILDFILKLTGCVFSLGLTIGGIVLAFYCFHIGSSLNNISSNDTFSILVFTVIFGLTYLFFLISITCTFALPFEIIRLLFNRHQKLKAIRKIEGIKKRSVRKLKKYKLALFKIVNYFLDDKNEKYTLPTIPSFLFAFFGILFIYRFGSVNSESLYGIVYTSFVCGFFIHFILYYLRENKKPKNTKKIEFFILLSSVIFLVIPLFLAPEARNKILEISMLLSKHRYEETVVHIKKPYNKLATLYGYKNEKSSIFGEQYVEFHEVTILLTGFGKKVVIESKNDKNQSFEIPSDDIVIVPSESDSKKKQTKAK